MKRFTLYQAMFAFCLLALFVVFSPTSAIAKIPGNEINTDWLINADHPPVAVRFMLTGQVDPQQKTVEGLLEVKLDKDWKTYWHTPGEGGIAPSLDWTQSSNLDHVDWHWPVPQRYRLMGIDTIGYKERALFPMTLHINDMGEPVNLKGKLTLSSCTTICVLTDYQIALNFAPDQLQPAPGAMHLYNQGISRIPRATTGIQLKQASWNQTKETVTLSLTHSEGWQTPDIFVDANEGDLSEVSFGRPAFSIDGNTLTAVIKATSWLEAPKLANKTLSLVITDQNLAAELAAPLSTDSLTAPAGHETDTANLFIIIGFALLGGLILNIMPCVLPVLGMKLSTVISAQGLAKDQIRRQFLASAAGILVSFWLLAGFLALLKFSGQSMGWGIQFQNPYFIGAMVVITGLFAANMLGLFEIQLPGRASTWLATRGDHSISGHFIQGMFATLLATPCSAPFLGTAVAFALAADLLTLWLIFSALAIGMALPWLLIAAFPALAGYLPKPGRWMNGVKITFGVLMLASSLWLLSLMITFLGILITAIVAGIGLTVLLCQLWRVKGQRIAIISLASLILVAALVLLINFMGGKKASSLHSELHWQPLDTALIQQSVQQGKTVFVDVTADWCVTCKANKIGVLLQDPVYSRLQAANIVRVQGDWTRPSETVTAFLQSYGRYGVPFNIVYGPGAPEGIALPVILTREAVIQAINTADGQGSNHAEK